MKKKLLLPFFLLIFSTAFSQDFSNKGKEFFLCFPQHVPSANVLATLSIWITSDRASRGTITMANGAFNATFNIAANGLQEIQIPHAIGHIGNAESGLVIQKSITIKVDPGQPPVVAYAQQWGQARSAATLLLPTSVLGKKYRAISFTQNGTGGTGQLDKSQFQVIAVKPNTQVRVTPRLNGVNGTAFLINLPNVGDMYQYQSDLDITGTYIESVIATGSSSCLPIAVFSGSSNLTFGNSNGCNGGSYDPLFQQLYPTPTWGKNYGFIPSADYPNGNAYRVMASEDNTTVYFDGTVVATLNAGEIYPNNFGTNPVHTINPINITSDKPVCVAQYMSSNVCGGGGFGDPDMVILNPVEQNIKDITIFSSTQQNITRQWVNVLIKTIAVPSFQINGVAPPASAWQAFPTMPGFSYMKRLFPGAGSYRLRADSGFNAIAFGFSANFESYAYSAGTNVKDPYQQVGVTTLYGIEPVPTVCTNSPFKFKISLPYRADSLKWDLSLLPGPPSPSLITMIYNNPPAPVVPPDSITTVNGKQIYWYSLPNFYTFNTVGVFPVTITAYAPNTEGCGTEQEIDFDLDISDPPTAAFTNTNPRCIAETVQFTDVTSTVKPVYIWYWNFDDTGSGAANTAAIANPTHLFTTPGNHNIKFATITTAGCVSDTINVPLNIPAMPNALISGNTVVCQNAAAPVIRFTGSGGSAPYTFTYKINGGADLTVTTTATSNIANVTVPTGTPGTFNYTLVRVQNTGSTLCQQLQTGLATVIVRPLPLAAITASDASVCQNAASPTITFTGSNATAPYTFTYTINAGVPQTITTTSANSITIPVPTGTPGTYTYNITNIREASSSACARNLTGISTPVLVRTLPTASISGDANLCQNGPSSNITFTGAGGTAPYTFTYKIGTTGTPQTLTTTAGNSVTVTPPTTTVGTVKYILLGVREGSVDVCTQTQADTVTITVSRVPAAAISGTSSICLNGTAPVVTFTGSNGIAPYRFTYNLNGGTAQTISTTTGNSVSINAPSNVAGLYNYNLVSVSDASPALCSSVQTGTAAITIQALPTATITGTTAVCQNAVQPLVTFTGAGGTAPYRFTYNINGGATQTVNTTAASNTVTLNVPTNIIGPFVYNLLSVTEGGANQCSRTYTTGSATFTVNPLPTANISGSTSLCQNAARPLITFTGANGTAPYTFTYNINGGTPQTITTTTGNIVTLQAPTNTDGVFNYNLLSVKDGSSTQCLQNQTGTATITVWRLPVAAFTWSAITCEEEVINFNGSSSVANAGSISNWSWNFGDPSSGSLNTASAAVATTNHTFADPNNYTVKLTVTTSNGCVSAPIPQTVTIHRNPVAGFTMPEVCLLDPYAEFTDTSRPFGTDVIQELRWNFGDAINSTIANPNTAISTAGAAVRHRYIQVGPYPIQIIAITDKGCRDTILPLPILFINGGDPRADLISVAGNNYCSADTVLIQNRSTITSGSITKIEIFWDAVGEPTSSEVDDEPFSNKIYKHKYPVFNSPASKTYNIRMVAYSGATCSSDDNITVTVNAMPNAVFNSIPSVCLEDPSFQLTQASETAGLAPGVSGGYFSGTGITSSSGIFDPSVAGAGTHTILYKFTSTAGCEDTASSSITVHPMPTVDADRGQQWVMLEGGQLQLDPIVTGNELSYLWTHNLGGSNSFLSSPIIRNPVATPVEDITYTLTVTARGGCKTSDDIFIKVLKVPAIPNTFSPNGDGINDKWVIKYLDTYPTCKIKVFTRTGQLVFQSYGYRTPWNGTMNGKTLPLDTYYYIIEPESGRKPYTGYVTIVK